VELGMLQIIVFQLHQQFVMQVHFQRLVVDLKITHQVVIQQ
jgi:hypothetical protein